MYKLEINDFERELAEVLNRYGIDQVFGTPDYILAAYINNSLNSILNFQKSKELYNHLHEVQEVREKV